MAKSKKQPKQPKTTSKSPSKNQVKKYKLDETLSVVITPFNEQNSTVKSYIKKLMARISVKEIIVVGLSLNDELESLNVEQNEGIIRNIEGGTVQDGVLAATGEHVLVVDDLAISPNNLVNWLEEDATLPKDKIWAASRHHKETKTGEGYKITIWLWLLNMLTRLLTGIVSQDVVGGFRLYPTDLAKGLFANVNRTDQYYALELLHQAKLYEIEVVDQPINVSGEAPNLSLVDALTISLGAWLKSWVTWGRYYFVLPAKDAKSNYFSKKESPWFRLAFAVTAILLFVLMPMLSSDYGMTADEYVQNEYGNRLYKYYNEEHNYDAFFYKDLYNYGGLFDYWATKLNHTFGGEGVDPYDIRHFLNSLFGAFMMLFIGLVGRMATGTWSGGLLALFFVIFSPRMFGHSMNNPKDIPFAAAYIFTIYHAIRFTQQLPRPTLRTSLAVVLGIAAAINIRIGGLLLIAYVAAFSGITFLWKEELRKQLLNIPLMAKMLFIGGLIATAGLYCGTLYWPYGALDWTKKPFEVLEKMSHYYVGIRVLFDAKNSWSDTVPWNYIPNWMLYTTPLFILIGFITSPLMAFLRKKEGKSLTVFLVAFAGLFPILYVIYQKSGLYDAIRHMLFAYTLFPVLAAFAWYSGMRMFNNKAIAMGIGAVLLILMALPGAFMVRNHPYQYTYFNELIGGNQGAFKKYESDYWMVSMRRSCDWFKENIADKDTSTIFRVATNCISPVHHYLDRKNTAALYVRYHEREKKPWDYGIFYSRFINNKFLTNEVWPPGEIIHVEEVDGVPIGVVVKRKSPATGEAGIAFENKDWNKAITLFEEIVRENPKNESAYLLLSQAYSQIQNWEKMKVALDASLKLSDEYSNTWGMLGAYYMNQNNPQEARKAFQKAVDLNYKYTFGNFHLARMLIQENRLAEAMERLEQFDAYGGNPRQGYDLAIQVAQRTGNDLQRLYFSAKKMSMNKKWPEAMKLLQQSLQVDPTYEPALKMKRSYDDAVAQQLLKQEFNRRAKKK